MKIPVSILALLTCILLTHYSFADGLATCDSGPESGWQSRDTLEKQLTEKGWKVRRIKVDQGCYEVYALDENGKRVEAYFHPQTLESVPIDESKKRW